ncbi:hypothetical protein [Brevibacillus sp. SYSU BS000544]|uniref:hypothetical protein n=1 Tax=Brevibacillus sp. SYSU BS000544 TaxID=3416443 RepID=UPI003CE48A5E
MLKKFKVLHALTAGVLASLALGVGITQVSAEEPFPTQPGVYVFKDADFKGKWIQLVGQWDHLNTYGSPYEWNDSISSVKIIGNYELMLADFHNLGGNPSYYRFDDRDLSDDPIGNDRATSFRVREIPQSEMEGVYLYEHAGFSGAWQKFTPGSIRELADNKAFPYGLMWNDAVSSVRIVGPYKVTLFEHDDYLGKSLIFDQNSSMIPDLVPYGFNDKTSSVQVVNN